MRLFGLTGGIASGKSAVAARFRARGLPVIDADEVARAVVEPGSEGLAALVTAFGRDVLTDDGRLDRPKLGALVFGDEPKRRALNAILHPRIAAETQRRAAALAAQGEPLAAYDAALLVENGLADAFRPLVVVAASESLQLARLMARDRLDEAQARARLAAQLPLAEKVRVADHVIDNHGSLAELEARADEVLAAIRSLDIGAG